MGRNNPSYRAVERHRRRVLPVGGLGGIPQDEGAMSEQLAERVAAALGWSVADVRSFSLPTLREFVRSPKLRHEIELATRGPGYIGRAP